MLRRLTSLQHPLVKHLVKVRQNSDYRYDHQSILLEGVKLIQEAATRGPLKTLLVSDESLIPERFDAQQVYVVPDAILQKISGMQTSEGVLAEIEMPPQASLKECKRIIALDGISDPGNLGTLLRTALALGWDGAYILPTSCDPYNEKALRAARGATLRLPLAMGSWTELQTLIAANDLQSLAADLDGAKIDEVKIKGGLLLVLGNEAHGISDEASKLCRKITIPMSGEMESLNVAVAGGILMHALRGCSKASNAHI